MTSKDIPTSNGTQEIRDFSIFGIYDENKTLLWSTDLTNLSQDIENLINKNPEEEYTLNICTIDTSTSQNKVLPQTTIFKVHHLLLLGKWVTIITNEDI